MAAGLERDVERRLAEIRVAAGRDRVDLGVGAAELRVPALPQHGLLDRDDRADDRVGVGAAEASLCQLDRPLEVREVGLRAGLHTTRSIRWRHARAGAFQRLCRLRRCARRGGGLQAPPWR